MIKLVKSNIHKDKGVLAAFLLIIIISTMLLHTGLFVSRYDKIYDEEAKRQNISDASILCAGDKVDIEKTIEAVSDVESYRMSEIVYADMVEYTKKDSDENKKIEYVIFSDMKNYIISEDIYFVERDDSVSGNKAYINLYKAYNACLHVGDTITIKSDMLGEYEITIAGIYEDLMAGNNYFYSSVIVDDKSFKKMQENAEGVLMMDETCSSLKMLMVDFKEGVSQEDGLGELTRAFGKADIRSEGFVRNLYKKGYTGLVKIVAAFMTTFSAVLMLICFIMIIFTVNNNIDRDIRNIGALRAVGHTSSQVRNSLKIEFTILGLIGSIIGIILSYVLYPLLEVAFIRSLTGMAWRKKFYPFYTFGVIAVIIAVTLLVVHISTIKIKNIKPATALRFGLESNSFKKNHLPLAKTKGNVNILLAIKSALQSKGQNIAILGIILVSSFVAMFSMTLYYNTKIDVTKFQRLLQGDAPDAFVTIKDLPEEEIYEVIDKLQNINGVSQAYGLSTLTCSVAGNDSTLLYVSNPDYVYCGVYEGKMLKEDNEVVIGKITADKAGVKVGDEIEVEVGNKKARYLVTGLQQAVYGMGERVYMTDGGAKRLGIDINHNYIRIRLTDPNSKNVDVFLDEAKQKLGDICTDTENYYKFTRSDENVPVYAVTIIIYLLVILSVLTILIVIRLLLKTVFIKKEKEFGIKKAVGFTSGQLRLQIALSLLPTTIFASIIGAFAGYLLINPMFALIFRGFGIMKSDLIIKMLFVLPSVVLVSLVVFGFGYIMSGKMKKISAYNLIQE